MKKCVLFLIALILLTLPHCLFAQGTAFTYQGSLSSNAIPVDGFFDFKFSLYTNAVGTGTKLGGTMTQTNLGVTNGLFTTVLDFGDVFTGDDTWLSISVRSNGAGSYGALTPLQELTPTPYAITASNVSGTITTAQLSGLILLEQLPGAVVTNNEMNVTLASLTLSSNLTLPSPASIDSGGNTLLFYDGNDNFYAGPNAGFSPSAGSANTGIGRGSLQNNSNGANNTAIGYQSLDNNTNGSYNTASGERALASNTSGNDNTADGRHALESNTNGSDNTAHGFNALLSNTSGNQNTADGAFALSGNPGGSNNIALGYQAGNTFGANESSNIDIGNPGASGDNNIIRLGSGQTSTFIAGVINGDGGGLTNLNASKLASGSIPLAQLPSAVVTNHEAANVTLSGTFSGNGAGLTVVDAATLGGLSSAAFWNINGNAGTSPGNGDFLGTTDNHPLELHVNGTRALRLEPDSRGDNAPNVIGGYSGNAVLQPGSGGDFIGGGGISGFPNGIGTNSSGVFIGAGSGNQVGPNVNDTVLGGGNGNAIKSPDSVVVGGVHNSVSTGAQYSFVGGGLNNASTALGGTVGGGAYNSSMGSAYGFSTVSGGQSNTAGNLAMVGGGNGNTADGYGSFIGGGGFDGSVYEGNAAHAAASVIGGGLGNSIPALAYGATVGGGAGNVASGDASVIGGGLGNSATAVAYVAFVGGGAGNITSGNASVIVGGINNTNSALGGTIGGGEYNSSSGNSYGFSTVSGGQSNSSGSFATVAGGSGNIAGGFGSFVGGGGFSLAAGVTIFGQIGNYASGQDSAIAGGIGNSASGIGSFIGSGGFDGDTNYAGVLGNTAGGGGDVICGGTDNKTSSFDSTVSGGLGNEASGDYSAVPGGTGNSAQGRDSFAAGTLATAKYDGSFVWNDDNPDFNMSDTGPNQFVAIATGGFFFYTSTSGHGAQLNTDDTSWTALSDRNAKKNIEPEDCQEVLNKLSRVPISHWHYNWEAETNTPHIGPMAQDFKHAFYPGRNDKGITTLEFDGVELAAIQGLNQKLEQAVQAKDGEIQTLKQQNDSLAARLNELEATVRTLVEKK